MYAHTLQWYWYWLWSDIMQRCWETSFAGTCMWGVIGMYATFRVHPHTALGKKTHSIMHCESISLFARTHSVTVFPPEIFRACAIPLHHCENKIPPCMIMHLHSEPKSTHTHMHTTTHTYICTLIPTHQQQQSIPSVLLLESSCFRSSRGRHQTV